MTEKPKPIDQIDHRIETWTPDFDDIWKAKRTLFLVGGPDHTESVVHALLRDALRARASDVHFDPLSDGYQIRFRVDGVLRIVCVLEKEEGMRMVRYFKTAADFEPGSLVTPQDARAKFELAGRELDIRVGCVPCVTGEKLALRLLLKDRLALGLRDLGLGSAQKDLIENWLNNLGGMFLDTGPVGSGKSTTLYAIINELDLVRRNIVTIEDPVEYQVDGITQMQVEERHGLEMATILKTILRLDPDYILVGEIRDAESARAAIEAAATGRVVLSTLHARDAAGTVTSLRNLGVEDHEIAVALSFVVAQRIVRKLCVACRREGETEDVDRRWLERLHLDLPASVWTAAGCSRCGGTGYFGRTGVFELWPLDSQGYQLVLNGADEPTIRSHIRERTGSSLLSAGLEKAEEGLTSLSELRGMSGLLLSR